MTEFETILQDCLRDLEEGASSVEQCLRRYPQHAGQLEPVLLASTYLARGAHAQLSSAFKARVRTRLLQQIYARPRRPIPASFPWMRLAAGLAVVLFALLATGTVYAQRALPGESFYGWKIASENIWRAVSPDAVGTDLTLAERRFNELIVVKDDPGLYAQTLAAYFQVVERLESQVSTTDEARVRAVLEAQTEELQSQGILPDEPGPNVVPPSESPIPTPVTAPLPTLTVPEIDPTDVPQILPTLPAVPEDIPTDTDLPRIVPTIEIPPIP